MKILTRAMARRVLFEDNASSGTTETLLKAHGVEFEYDGEIHVVHAKREIVLTAGYVYACAMKGSRLTRLIFLMNQWPPIVVAIRALRNWEQGYSRTPRNPH